LVIKDGKSVDETVSLAKQYLHPQDALIVTADSGIYDAMNQAVNDAKGEWILFLGADDQLACPSICRKIIELADPTDRILIGESVTQKGRKLYNRWGWRLLFSHSVNHQACLYHKSIFETYKYPTKYRLAADYWLNLRLYLNRTPIKRLHGTTISIFSEDGVSSKMRKVGQDEISLVKRELLGVWGLFSNALVKAWRSLNAAN